jgi:hypothetical protein
MCRNTVLLAVRMMGTTDKSPLMAGVSLAGFIFSGLLFGQLGARIGKAFPSESADHVGHKRRGWLLFSFGSQAAIIVANLIIVAPGLSRIFRPEGELGWIYLLLLAIQGGIQVTQVSYRIVVSSRTGCKLRRQRNPNGHDDHPICCSNIRSGVVRTSQLHRWAISESTFGVYRLILAWIICWGWAFYADQYLCCYTCDTVLQDHGPVLRHLRRRILRRWRGEWKPQCLKRTTSVRAG